MSSNDREEVAKWLRLGYETFGSEGASAVVQASGLTIRDAAKPVDSNSG